MYPVGCYEETEMVACFEEIGMLECFGQTESGQNVEIVLVSGFKHAESLYFLSLDFVDLASF